MRGYFAELDALSEDGLEDSIGHYRITRWPAAVAPVEFLNHFNELG